MNPVLWNEDSMAQFSDEVLNDVQGDQEEILEDEIPAYTVVPLTNNKIKNINIKKFASKRVASLFISDLLNTNKVRNNSNVEKHFCMGNMTFRSIMVRGIIVELQALTFKTKDRVLILVDDGTAVLDCFVEENKLLENLRTETQTQSQNTRDRLVLQPDNALLKAALMMLQSSKERISKLSHYKSFQRGDTVVLIGNLSEYKGKRTCFISSIINDSTAGNAGYLEDLDNLYQTAYL